MITEKYIDLDGQALTKKTWNSGNIRYTNKEGLYHRLDGPAHIFSNGCQAWYKNGLFHRLDGPAWVWSSGRAEYWLNGREVSRKDIDLYWLRKQVGK